MKRSSTPLHLRRESLRDLTLRDLPSARGGAAVTDGPACTVVYTLTPITGIPSAEVGSCTCFIEATNPCTGQ